MLYVANGMAMNDITGIKFGRLKVLKLERKDKNHRLYWLCECDCGIKKGIRGDLLKSGRTKSCGCLSIELLKERTKKKSPLGRVRDERLYGIWSGIKQRCKNENNKEFKRYGARGIKICREWDESYETFKTWCLSNGYEEGLSIDRIDNDGNYEPNNCRFSNDEEQANNRSNNILIEFEGKEQTLSQWSKETGIKYSCLYRRIKSNWNLNEVFKNKEEN